MFNVGDLVLLRCQLDDGPHTVPSHTLGIVVGSGPRGVPQVALEGYGIRHVPEHVIDPLVVPEVADDFVTIIAALLRENEALTRQLAAATAHRPHFTES